MQVPHPWLVADIGGTNARFGLLRAAGAPVTDVRSFSCAAFAGPEPALRAYLDGMAAAESAAPRPRALAFALATVIDGDHAQLTNSHWQLSAQALAAAFDAERVLLLNDFEALALALPLLADADLLPLGGGARDLRRPLAVIGPGTGLGVAGCLPLPGGGHVALATEGGHVTLAAADEVEDELLRHARGAHGHVSAERLLSGMGLPLLYRALAARSGLPFDAGHDAAAIARGARAGDPGCTQAIERFCAMLGSFAGNVALTLGARGGVLLAGGVAQQLADRLPHSAFRARFEAKGRFRDYLAPICTALITAPHAALLGAAQAIAAAQGRSAARP